MKILAVDDDPLIRELLSEVLPAIGFSNFDLAAGGDDAIEIANEQTVPFDCFLLDIQMPCMDGITLLSKLRSCEGYSRTPILMLTAMSDREYIDDAFAAGATDYINKPFSVSELQSRLNLIEALVLGRKQLSDRNPVRSQGNQQTLEGAADLSERLHISDVDGAIDYLSLENYLLQMSRLSLFGHCVFGVVIKDAGRMFKGSSSYDFRYAITDVAEAISECLKPHKFFVAHAGGGAFACMRDLGRQFDHWQFTLELSQKIREMELYSSDGKPLIVNVSVGEPILLDMKSPQSSVRALLQSLANAEAAATDVASKVRAETAGRIKRLFNLG